MMKLTEHTILFNTRILIMAAALAFSCAKGTPPDGTPTTLTVSLADGLKTKATAVTDESENIVNDLQVFVFDLGGGIDGYGHKVSGSDIAVSTHTGPHEAWAVTNAPDLSSVTTKAGLLSTVLALSDQRVGDMVLIGGKECNVSVNETVTIAVRHLASRSVTRRITNKLSPEALSSQTFKVTDLYLTNVAGDGNIGVSSAPSVWYNKMGLQGELEFFLHDAVPTGSQTVPLNGSYAEEHRFYMMPNLTDADSHGASWSPRYTRSLFRATIGGEEYFYPIPLPKGPNNMSYETTDIVVGRMGVKDEETELPFTAITYDVDLNAFAPEETWVSFRRLDTDIVFSEPGVNPLELVSERVDFSAPGTLLLFSDGSVSPWTPQMMLLDGSWSSSTLDLIVFFGDAVTGYDAVSALIEGKIGNTLAFTVGADVSAYANLEELLESTHTNYVTLVFGSGSVVVPEDIVMALAGHSVGHASFIFTQDGSISYDELERLIEMYGDFIVSVTVDGSVVALSELEEAIATGITNGPRVEFLVSIAEWEEANREITFQTDGD